MDHCSNINTDVCCRKTMCNKSVMHSKSLASKSGCRGKVKMSSEIL